MKKDEVKKKKEDKDKLKKQQKEERRQQYQKEQAQKEKEAAQKQNKLKRIHFLCLLKKMARRSWTMILWFSQGHLPVITPPKDPLSRLPLT